MCRCAAALTAQQRSGFSDDRQVRRSAKFVWKRSLTAINALQKRFRRAKAMVVQSYKGNRLSILYLNRFGRLAHLRRARRRGCRSKAAFVPLREAQAMSPKSAVCFISLCGVGRAEMSVCIYRRPKSAVRRIDSRALPLICAHRTMCCRPSRNRGVEECAAAAGLSASAEAETQTCAARAPARRPAGRQCAGLCAKAERIGAFFHPSAQRRVPAPPHMEYRYARGIPEKQAARTQLALMCGKIRHRLPPLCTEASDCETEASEPIPPKPFARFGATYRETARQKAAKRFSLRTKKRLRRAAADAYCSPVFFASR